MIQYDIDIVDTSGALVASIREFISLDYVLTVNNVGSANLVVPGIINVGEDYRLKIYRNGSLVGNTHFFVIKPTFKLSGIVITTEITCLTANAILSWPIVKYPNGSIKNHHSDYTGNIMKDIVRRNLGTGAEDVLRDMSALLSVEANSNDGVVISSEFGWKNVLESIQSVSDESLKYGARIVFDVVDSAGLLEFVTMTDIRGTDKTSDVLLSADFDTFSDVSVSYDYSRAASKVIVGGAGQEIWRNVVTVMNTDQVNNTPLGYIKEHFISSDKAATISQAQSIGYSYLISNRNRVFVSGTIQDTQGVRYGTDYEWGDMVSLEAFGNVFVLSIETVNVSVSRGEEKVSIDAKGDAS